MKADLQQDREPPVPIVAGKPAVLRVYMEKVAAVTQVTVEVQGAVTGSRALWLQPQCTVEQQRLSAGGCASADFYFTPAAGNFDITVKVKDASNNETDSHNLQFKARTTNSLKLKAVSICDAKDAAGNWLCAAAADLTTRAGILRKIAPTAGVSVQTTTSQVRRETSSFADMDAWWNTAIGDVANLHTIFDSISSLFGTTVRYYGMIRPALPGGTGGMANSIPGNGAGSRTSVTRLGVETASEVVAHETGHTLGLRHTNNNVPAAGAAPPGCYNTAVDGSTDWPFPNNRIQSTARLEVGFDVGAQRALDPQNTYEILSYCVPRWISPQRYKTLVTALSGGAVTSASAVKALATVIGPFWLVSGKVINNSVQFDPLFIFGEGPDTSEGTHRIEVVNSGGAVLATRLFTTFTPDAESAGPATTTGPPLFSVLVPQVAGAARLVVRSPSDQVLGTLVLGGAPPFAQLTNPTAPANLVGNLNLTWTIADADSSNHTTRVHYSADNGQTWSELGVVKTNSLVVNFDQVTGTLQARIRLIVSDGVNSTSSTFGPFTVPKKSSVTATILSPSNGMVLQPGNTLFLEGVGTDVDDGTLTGPSLTWSSDVAGNLGSGEVLGVKLTSGAHTISLKATDSDGNAATQYVQVLVAGAPPLVNLTTRALNSLPTTCVEATIAVTASGLPPALVDYSLNGGNTWIPVPVNLLPFRFIVPGSGFFHLVARAFDAAGQSTADDEQFFTSGACTTANTPPAITPSAVTRKQGESAIAPIATVSDMETTPGLLAVTVVSANPSNGVTISGIAVDSAGKVTANVAASCSAASTSFTLRVTDGGGATANGTLNVTVTPSTPVVSAAVGTSALWPPNHDLINVGLAASATGNCAPVLQVLVYSNEDDQTPTDPVTVHSPDAKDLANGTLRVRAERVGDGSGRVYLIVARATNTGGNTGFAVATVVVPKSASDAHLMLVNSLADAACAYAMANNGSPPPGYFVSSDGPVVGPKQ